jgi:serine/threonine protein kinase
MTLGDWAASLEPIPEEHIHPELPADRPVTVAPSSLDGGTAYFKPTGIHRYMPGSVSMPGSEGKDQLLEEVLHMETLSKRPHPYIVRYLGCRVRDGRINAIALEPLGSTLLEYARDTPDKFAQLDKAAFLAGVESAVKFMHSLGLAHNDISPNNVMVREADDGTFSPVLIDFDSCGPFGYRLLSAGSTNFVDTQDPDPFDSHKRHDEFALGCMRTWWDEQLEPGLDEQLEPGPDSQLEPGLDSQLEPGPDSVESPLAAVSTPP